MTTRLLIGDVFERMATLPDHSFDLIVTSPPFLALRSYLPDGHPDKAKEIGSEATPAAYLDVLLALSTEWRRLLAPHGSIAVELGDTYSGSGGAGGDYGPDGLRDGQPRFDGSQRRGRLLTPSPDQRSTGVDGVTYPPRRLTAGGAGGGAGWPLPKSLIGIPTLYAWSLAYGRNLLRAPLSAHELMAEAERLASIDPKISVMELLGRLEAFCWQHEESGPIIEIEPWRVRNLKPWIRSNPPVGALGDKERPATSYVVVACTGASRWFDLDAVRTQAVDQRFRSTDGAKNAEADTAYVQTGNYDERVPSNPGGAPPLDWWHHVDAVIDHILAVLDNKPQGKNGKRQNGPDLFGIVNDTEDHHATKGTHIRRALEAAGLLPRGDFYDVSPKGYAGAHYAVWPPELVRQLIDEMCPRRVCRECEEPSRRITQATEEYAAASRAMQDQIGLERNGSNRTNPERLRRGASGVRPAGVARVAYNKPTVGWSDCGCRGRCSTHDFNGGFCVGDCPDRDDSDHWRPGRVLDPFVGSGTTLAVASGMGRDSVGIDLDERSVDLALQRVGMFLDVDYGEKKRVG